MTLNRRQFVRGAGVAGLGLLAACGRLPGQAQQPVKIARIGYLVLPALPAGPAREFDTFKQALREYDWVDGQNLIIEWRFAEGSSERLAEMAEELVRLPVDVIVTGGEPAISIARKATTTIPIVMGNSSNPLEAGLINSLARPGGNVTGLTQLGAPLSGKRLELLKELLPEFSRVAVLADGGRFQLSETESAAQLLGVQLQSLEPRVPDDVERFFDAAAREGAEGVIVLGGPNTMSHQTRIVQQAAASRLPAMYDRRGFVAQGGLMSYAANFTELSRRAAYYVDRILKGAKPADLPVEQPREFEFVINLQTAQALGLTIPQHVLLQATEVIQ